jgi:hypothetical protein
MLLKPREGTEEDELRSLLGRLDGEKLFAVMLWSLPPGVSFELVDREAWPQSFVQAAGSDDRLTIEVRKAEDDMVQHFVIGRPGNVEGGHENEVITWNGCETVVMPNQVLDGDDARAIFVGYYLTGSVPAPYALHPLDPTQTTRIPESPGT